MSVLCFLHLFLTTGGAGVNALELNIAGVNALELNIAVKSGSSGILPCVYDKQYKENRKYLCWGGFWITCSILAYAGQRGKYSITDYPDQSIFIVRWDNLQTSDSGHYSCAVEIGGFTIEDAGYYLYLTVQSGKTIFPIRVFFFLTMLFIKMEYNINMK